VTLDGAGSHKIHGYKNKKTGKWKKGILDYSDDVLGTPNNVPKHWLLGVPNTTFATQPCDCGIIKDLKYYFRPIMQKFRNTLPIQGQISRSRVLVCLHEAYQKMVETKKERI